LYTNARRFFEQGRVVICTDEKTGMQILERTSATQPIAPGQPEKREYEYIRRGTRVLLASCVVPTGPVVWNLGQTRTSTDFATHLANVIAQLPKMKRSDWVVDHLNTHWSLDACRVVAQWCKVPLVAVFHCTPTHGSWLNQVELWLSVLARRFLKRGDFCSAQDFAARLCDSLEVYNTHQAHLYRWTYTGQHLVRATPFSQTRQQQRQGRTWVQRSTQAICTGLVSAQAL
jgi:hypothetical protein